MMMISMTSGDARKAKPGALRPASLPAKALEKLPSKAPRKPERVRRPEPPRDSLEPSVLVVGADELFLPALKLALARHRVHVETAPLEQAVEAAVVAAPDLILLAGDAARDTRHELLSRLTSSPVSSVIPVALLGDDSALDARLNAFRHGAVAVIPRSASVDQVAEAIAKLAREIPERGGEALGQVGEATLEEFVAELTRELRSGILSVTQGNEKAPVRLVLGGGRPLAAFIDEFVTRVRSHVVEAEALKYEFDERAGGTVQLLSSERSESEPPPSNIQGLRLLLADDDPARADVVAQELRKRGAVVAVSALDPADAELRRLRVLDPEVVIVGERELEGQGYALLRRLKRDTRLRWVSLLVVRWDEIRDPTLLVPMVDRITGPLATLAEADRGLCDRAELGDAFDARLEVSGPARCLRALAASGSALRVTVTNPRLKAEIDISNKLLVGATASAPSGERWEGAQALAALMVISSGRVHVEPCRSPATTNLMSPAETAFDLAEHEAAPIAPSLPAPTPTSQPAPTAIPRAAPVPHVLADPFAETAPEPTPLEPAPATQQGRQEPPLAAQPSLSPRTSFTPRTSLKPKWVSAGVSGPFVALLVALAIIQGLVYAGALNFFRRRGGEAEAAAKNTPAPAPTAAAREAARPQSAVATAPPPAPLPSSSAAAPATDSAATAAAAEPAEPTGVDESGQHAPTCEALLTGVAPSTGQYPGAAYEQLRLARRAIVLGKADDAQRAYCTAIRWDAQNPLYYFELAQLFLIRRDGAAAAEAANRGVRLEPGSTKGQSIVGDGLARVGDFEGARRAWYAAASVNTPSPREIALLTLRASKEAEQALAARDYLRAERFYRRASVLDLRSASARRGLASTLLRLGEPNHALLWAEAAVKLDAEDALNQVTLGEARLATGDQSGARSAFTEAQRLGFADARRRLEKLGKE
jgi:DNA-binding NarL/FixJ family response regulator/tetratricopeptide (TPR) repeat protein